VEKHCTAGQATDERWRMRTACWIPNATDTHLEYVVLTAFPLQHWLRERTLMLNLYIHRMSCRRLLAAGDPRDIDTRTLPCSVLQILNDLLQQSTINCPSTSLIPRHTTLFTPKIKPINTVFPRLVPSGPTSLGKGGGALPSTLTTKATSCKYFWLRNYEVK